MVSSKYPDASEDVLKAAFDKTTNSAETITFEEYENALALVKEPDFKLFTENDSSSPKDGYMTFEDWKTEALKIWLLATGDEL